MKHLIWIVAIALLSACSTIPEADNTGQGRLLIFSDLKHEGGTGPWWDYHIWARHLDSGEKVVIHIKVRRGMSHHVSSALEPGQYKLYEWNSVSKNSNKAYDHNITGSFFIKPNTITLFDKEHIVTSSKTSQGFNFKNRSKRFIDRRYEALAEKEPRLKEWPTHWGRTESIRW